MKTEHMAFALGAAGVLTGLLCLYEISKLKKKNAQQAKDLVTAFSMLKTSGENINTIGKILNEDLEAENSNDLQGQLAKQKAVKK